MNRKEQERVLVLNRVIAGVELARTRYAGFNHQHLTGTLNEEEKIAIKRASVRRILPGAGIAGPRKRRAPKHHIFAGQLD